MAEPLPQEFPSYARLAEVHNGRIAKLARTYSQGVIELRWSDQSGRHFQQGNLELWIVLPGQTALRVEKLGEVLLWLGSDQSRFWLFDMLKPEKALYVGRHDEPADQALRSGLDVRPLALLDLMGLFELPPEGAAPKPVAFDAQHNAWVSEFAGRGGPLRAFFHRQDLTPVRVEVMDAAGRPVLISSLSRYATVPLANTSPLASPKLAQLIDIASAQTQPGSPAADGRPAPGFTGQVKIAINQTTGIMDRQPLDRVFDLERLIRGFNPSRVEGLASSQGEPAR